MKKLLLRNTQRDRTIDRRAMQQSAQVLLDDLLGLRSYQLAIHFVPARRMAEMNEYFLDHKGSTDVITFDYRQGYPEAEEGASKSELAGEIFISVADALAQARLFRTQWQEEVLRYIIHGVLHLQGFDDLNSADRRKMKTAENRLLRKLTARAA